MRPDCLRRPLLALAALLALTTFSEAALPPAGAPPPEVSLAGQLLVAAPDMGDPRFHHAVILIVLHDRGGALGIMINRPVGEHQLSALMQAMGEDAAGVVGSVRLFAGGPVAPGAGFVLHSADYHGAATIGIDEHVAMTATPAILRDIARHRGPRQSLVAFGYSGWGPGQLEDELARHAWFTIAEDPKLVFDADREKVWDQAVARRTLPL